MGDWISEWMHSTDNLPSPEVFRLWCGISAVAGALEHRVRARTTQGEIFPNLYLMLVAPPGVGKSKAMEPLRRLWVGTKHVKVAPNSVTKAALLDVLEESHFISHISETEIIEYNALSVASSELGVLIPSHDLEFLSVLTDIYDCPDIFAERRRTSKSVEIVRPQLNIIAGTQPGFLSTWIPEEAWTQGFMSRVIMVYSAVKPHMDLFAEVKERSLDHLLVGLKAMVDAHGIVEWELETQDELVRWYEGGLEPIPIHPKLTNYCVRRLVNLIKLCIIASVSRVSGVGPFVITLEDLNRARTWLLSAEMTMPIIFQDMKRKSDDELIRELHIYAMAEWNRTKSLVPGFKLGAFLQDKAPSMVIPRIIEQATRAQWIVQQPGTDLYMPRAMDRSWRD